MIDKCVGSKCPLKRFCMRYTSPKVSERQNILRPTYFINDNNEFECESFWGNQTEIIMYNLTRYIEYNYENKKSNK